MSYFAALLSRTASTWQVSEAALADCESVSDVADVLRDVAGDVRLVVIEQDDEYAAIVRLDDDAATPRVFLSDGHAADSYAVAGYIAEDLDEVGSDDAFESEADDSDADSDPVDLGTPLGHESVPLGDAGVAEDLGTAAEELLALCAHEGTLPIDVLSAVCERAGCGAEFDELRG